MGGLLYTVDNDPPSTNPTSLSAIQMICQTSPEFETCRTWYTFPEGSLQKSGNANFQYNSWFEGCAYGFMVGGGVTACKALCAASSGCCSSNNYGYKCASNSCSGGGCCAGTPHEPL